MNILFCVVPRENIKNVIQSSIFSHEFNQPNLSAKHVHSLSNHSFSEFLLDHCFFLPNQSLRTTKNYKNKHKNTFNSKYSTASRQNQLSMIKTKQITCKTQHFSLLNMQNMTVRVSVNQCSQHAGHSKRRTLNMQNMTVRVSVNQCSQHAGHSKRRTLNM